VDQGAAGHAEKVHLQTSDVMRPHSNYMLRPRDQSYNLAGLYVNEVWRPQLVVLETQFGW